MLKNIFTSYLYEKKLDINSRDLHEHILEIESKDREGVLLTNRGGWQSKVFTERNIFNRTYIKILWIYNYFFN